MNGNQENDNQENEWTRLIERSEMMGARNFRISNVFHAPGRALFGDKVHIGGDLSLTGDIVIKNNSLKGLIENVIDKLDKINERFNKLEKRLTDLETHVNYMPEGDGYIEAKDDFNKKNKL